jgi:hypothetical protein
MNAADTTFAEDERRSRRAVLAAALGGAAALMTRSAVQPGSARAAGDDGQPILVGSTAARTFR